ncbi:hypothetical protein AMECASPLE_010914 [Ameca splendens]|uniref:Uncharacterized protein n=1 Tax=Ameca splendens TaxID=208324 RepID=A0ABV0Z9T5_9TELE
MEFSFQPLNPVLEFQGDRGLLVSESLEVSGRSKRTCIFLLRRALAAVIDNLDVRALPSLEQQPKQMSAVLSLIQKLLVWTELN